jgi:hypothetical protein
MPVARAHVSRTGKLSGFKNSNLPSFEHRTKHAGCGRVRVLLQFTKASAATLLQQEKNDTADVQRGRVNISGFIGAVAS